MQVERLFDGVFRRPGVVMPPLVGAGLEYVGLGELEFFLLAALLGGGVLGVGFFFVLEEVLEKGQLDLVAVVLGGFGVEIHAAQVIAVGAGPLAVIPRAHNQD